MSHIKRKKIVVVAPNWLGDAVMSLPLVGLLGATEGVSLCVFAPEYVARVYWNLVGVDELMVFSRRGRVHRIITGAGILKRLEASAAVILPPSFSSAAAAFFGGVKIRVGYRTDGRGMLLTDAVSPQGRKATHLSEHFIRLGEKALDRVGIKPGSDYDTLSVCVSDSDVKALEGVFTGQAAPERYAVVLPGATYGPAKSWPWERYRELVGELSQEITVVLAGGGGEKEICDLIADGNNGIYNICGRTSLAQLFALLSRASVVIANDSGPPHVAASLGVPVVVLFGSTSPAWTAPLGASVNVVNAPVDCSPCFRKTCPTQLECFAGIEPRVVLEHARAAAASNAAGARV